MALATLTWQLGDNTGEWGWVRRGWSTSWADPSRLGGLLAHDILEHILPNQKGHAHQELSAFGAIVYGRYNQGMLTGNFIHSPDQSLAIEILDFLMPHDFDWCLRYGLGRHHYQGPRSGFALDALEDIRYITHHMLPENGGNKYINKDWGDPRWISPEGIKFIESWLVNGYLAAHRRYWCSGTLASLFSWIQDDIDQAMKRFSGYDLYEGAKMHVWYNPHCSADTKVKIESPYWD